jgi:ABC-2 type transport system permease protein
MTATLDPGADLGWRLQGRLVANEIAKSLQLVWRRRALTVTTAVAQGVVYLGITLPALVASVVAVTAALQGSGGIGEEINAGTLEQAQLGPGAPELQVVSRFAALGVEGLLGGGVLGVAFGAGFGLHFHLTPALVVPAVLTIVAALGYGLVITGLTVRVASIGAVTHVANMAVQFFGGMLVPVALFPHGLEIFARFLPITLGIEALDASLAGKSLAALWAGGTLPLLVVYALASFALGMAIYSLNIRRARRQGGLAPR